MKTQVYKRIDGKVVRVKLPKQDSRFEERKELEVDYPADGHSLPTLGNGGGFKSLKIRKVGI